MVGDDTKVIPILREHLRPYRIIALRIDDWFTDEIGYQLVFPKREGSKLQPVINVRWSGLELVQNRGPALEDLIVTRFQEAVNRIYKAY